jgi:O-methyltransferase
MRQGTMHSMLAFARYVVRTLRVAFVHGGVDAAMRVLRRVGVVRKYRGFTLVSPRVALLNLLVADRVRSVPGCVVECGVWKGGMIAALAESLGPRRGYHLFDSFEGLPPAQPVDGTAALAWQRGRGLADNCRAEASYAQRAMEMSGVPEFRLHRGWFEATLPGFRPPTPVSLLRLDADWFASTRICLETLARHVAPRGLVVVDDYDTWEGCARAVRGFLAEHREWRLHRAFGSIAVLARRPGRSTGRTAESGAAIASPLRDAG